MRIEYDAYANIPWIHSLVAYTSNALKDPRIKIIGVCFGHQIIGRALGVKVRVNNLGWELGIVSIDLSPTGKALFDKDTLVSKAIDENQNLKTSAHVFFLIFP